MFKSRIKVKVNEMQTVYVVLKNADTIEGRGPMVLDSIYDTEAAADFYIRNVADNPYNSDYENPKKYSNYTSYDGWYNIYPQEVLSKTNMLPKDKRDKLQAEAIALTDRLKELRKILEA